MVVVLSFRVPETSEVIETYLSPEQWYPKEDLLLPC